LGALLVAMRNKVTSANYDNIRKGMTENDVEVILGGPPGDYKSFPRPCPPGFDAKVLTQHGVHHADGETIRGWMGEEGTAIIFLDSSGRVREMAFMLPRESEGRFTRFFDWLEARLPSSMRW